MNKDKRDTYSNDVDLCKLLSPNITAYILFMNCIKFIKLLQQLEIEREREKCTL